MAEITGEPVGFVVALRFSDGTWDPDSPDCAGMWPTSVRAAADAADPEMAGRLANGQQWVVCGLVPIEDRCIQVACDGKPAHGSHGAVHCSDLAELAGIDTRRFGFNG